MATYYVDSGAGALEMIARTWASGELMVVAKTDVTTNHLIAKQWIWECTTPGTSTGTPTWPASVTDDVTTVTETGGVVWTARAPDNWTHAMPGLYWLAANTTTKKLVAGDRVYMKSTHSKMYNESTDLNCGGNKADAWTHIMSVDVSLNPTVGAREKVTDGMTLTITGKIWVYGVEFYIGNGGNSNNHLFIGSSSVHSWIILQSCIISFDTQMAMAYTVNLSTGYTSGYIQLLDCTWNIYNWVSYDYVRWLTNGHYIRNLKCNNKIAFVNGGTIVDSDLHGSYSSWGYQGYGGSQTFINCKLNNASFSLPGQGSINAGQFVEAINVSSSDSILHYAYASYNGEIRSIKTIYLTTGASQYKEADGSMVSYSLEINPNTTIAKTQAIYTPWVSKFIGGTGSKTVSMEVAYDAAVALTDNECFIEVEYFSETGTPKGDVAHSAPVITGAIRDPLVTGSSLSDTSAAWTGTSGWTNKKTHTLSKTVTINQQGYVRCRIGVCKDVTVYVNQTITVS